MHVDRRDICSRHASPGFSRVARHDVPAGKAVWHPGRVSQQHGAGCSWIFAWGKGQKCQEEKQVDDQERVDEHSGKHGTHKRNLVLKVSSLQGTVPYTLFVSMFRCLDCWDHYSHGGFPDATPLFEAFRKWRGNTDSRCVFEAKKGKILS